MTTFVSTPLHRRGLLLGGAAAAGVLGTGVSACGETARVIGRPAPTTGLDAARVAQTMIVGRSLPKLRSVIVARDGQTLFEEAVRGPGLDQAVNIKSASKSVLAAVAGVAIGRGVVELEQPISTWLSDRFPAAPDPRLSEITVEDLLTMRAGLASTSGANYGRFASSPNWVRFILAQPFQSDPGGALIYSTGTSHLTSAVLTRASGRSTLQLARDYLAEPLGVTIPSWAADPQGIYFGGNEMRMSPRALLTFGELYRNDGVHAGTRVLPDGWVQASWRGRGNSRFTGDGYGYGWWMRRAGGHDVFYAWGYGGQMVFVVPDLNLTVVMTSDPTPVETRDGHVQALHALLADGFIPAAQAGSGPTDAGAATPGPAPSA